MFFLAEPKPEVIPESITELKLNNEPLLQVPCLFIVFVVIFIHVVKKSFLSLAAQKMFFSLQFVK